jgi:drug/metabolite transporter (DMT)-like permease
MSTKDWLRFWVLGLIWGTSFLWIKIAVSEVSPFVLVGFRTLFGAAGLLAILWLGKNNPFRWAKLRPWIGIFTLVGLFNVALPFILISWSEQYIASGIASILNSTVPFFTMILAPIFLKDDRWTVTKVLGLFVGFAGVVILFLPQLRQGFSQNLLGQGVMLLATLSYAFGSVYTRLKTKGMPPQLQAFLQLGLASIMVWLVTLGVDRPILLPRLPLTWLALLWLGLLGSCVAYILYFSLLHSIGPTRATTVTYIPPLVGVILGAVFLGEQLSWQEILGGLLILSGIAVVNMKLAAPKEKPLPELEEE